MLDLLFQTDAPISKYKTWRLGKDRRYPAETITDADYTDDLVLLASRIPAA